MTFGGPEFVAMLVPRSKIANTIPQTIRLIIPMIRVSIQGWVKNALAADAIFSSRCGQETRRTLLSGQNILTRYESTFLQNWDGEEGWDVVKTDVVVPIPRFSCHSRTSSRE